MATVRVSRVTPSHHTKVDMRGRHVVGLLPFMASKTPSTMLALQPHIATTTLDIAC